MMTLNDGRTELWQWDTGRKLTVDVDCSQVHFSNKVFGRSVDVDVVDGTAAIPDVLLQVDKELIAWAFVGTAENGYTKISKVFKVKKRNKPADYVFTPPEQTTLQKLVERLTAIEESQDPDAIKNAVEDYLEQNPVESPVQSVNGYTGNVELTAKDVGAISKDKLQEATNEALAQAKASGEFDGADGSPGPKGDGGKSAYEYAKEGGYQGTEAQFIAKLAAEIPYKTSQLQNDSGYLTDVPVKSVNGQQGDVKIDVPTRTSQIENDSGFITAEDIPEIPAGNSGIHIGPEPPTDPNVVLWIDTDEDPPESGGGGGADWGASEGEPGYVKNRTHWVETGETLMEETTLEYSEDAFFGSYDGEPLSAGELYEVKYNGKKYIMTASESDGGLMLGYNISNGKGKEFPVLVLILDGSIGALPFDGAETCRLSIARVVVHPLADYLVYSRPLYLDLNSLGLGTNNRSERNYDDIAAALHSGRTVVITSYTETVATEQTVTAWTWVADFGLMLTLSSADDSGVRIISFSNGTWTPMG